MKTIELNAKIIIYGSIVESDKDLARAIIETEQLVNHPAQLPIVNGHKFIPRLHINCSLEEV